MLQFLIPALIGAATNKDDPLKGALMGGTLGALTGGLANPAATGATSATQAALNTGVAEGAKSAAAQQGVANLANTAVNPLMSNQIAADAAKQFAQAGGQMSLTPTSVSALTGAGTMSPATSALTAPVLPPEPSALGAATARVGEVIKNKPIQSAEFITEALGGGQKPMAMQAQPLVQKPFTPVVQEQDDSPRFVSKPLFEQEKRKFDLSRNNRAQEIIGRRRDRRANSLRTRGLL